jgi:hypothetical protein
MNTSELKEEPLLSKACRTMMSFKPCTILFRDGTELKCEKIIKPSVTIIGNTIGSVTVIVGGRSEELIADYIKEIRQ